MKLKRRKCYSSTNFGLIGPALKISSQNFGFIPTHRLFLHSMTIKFVAWIGNNVIASEEIYSHLVSCISGSMDMILYGLNVLQYILVQAKPKLMIRLCHAMLLFAPSNSGYNNVNLSELQ